MFTPVVAQRSLLRAVGIAPALRSKALPALAATQRRFITKESITPAQSLAILNSQREKRPNSPHLAIYQPQLTWYLSIFNRMTGAALSTGLYAGAIVFLLHPLYPVIDSAHLVSLVADLPTWLKVAGKFTLAIPFTFHTFNGVRHLAWDMNSALSLKGVYGTGYVVLGLTVASSLYLATL